jgi:hypothetical protein
MVDLSDDPVLRARRHGADCRLLWKEADGPMKREELTQHLQLQVRVDVLENMVLILGSKLGAEPAKMNQVMASLHESCWQKRLEDLERIDPALAAELSNSTDFSKIDLDLLEGLFFDGDKPQS